MSATWTLAVPCGFLALLVMAAPATADPVLVFSTDFNSGAPPEFSGVVTTEDVQGYAGLTGPESGTFSGLFLRNATAGNPAGATTLTLTGLPAHSSVTIALLVAFIDSWDGLNPTFGPDIFNVVVDGGALVSSSPITNFGPPPSGSAVLSFGTNLGFAGEYPDSAFDLGGLPFSTFPHTASTLSVSWFASGAGWQGGRDESWAIENVSVFVEPRAVPEPVASALLLIGTAAFAVRRMRRRSVQR